LDVGNDLSGGQRNKIHCAVAGPRTQPISDKGGVAIARCRGQLAFLLEVNRKLIDQFLGRARFCDITRQIDHAVPDEEVAERFEKSTVT
jgi:hypothetical protein